MDMTVTEPDRTNSKNRKTFTKNVLIFGLGTVGQRIARLAAKQGFAVSAVNRAGAKVGQDLGRILDIAALKEQVVADCTCDLTRFGADIAVVATHDRLAETIAHHRRLLEAGLNVICIGAESSYPRDVNPALADELDRIAQANGVTFTGCGLWDTYRIWTLKTLVGPCTGLTRLHHQSVTDINRFGPEVAKLVRIGEQRNSIPLTPSSDRSIYRVFLAQVTASLGLSIKTVEEWQEPVFFDVPVHCTALQRLIEPGECAGRRTVITLTTHEGVTARAKIDLRLTVDKEGEWMSWEVDGTPPAAMRLEKLDTGHATASSVVNRLNDVIAAPPGLVTVDQLAPMSFDAAHLTTPTT